MKTPVRTGPPPPPAGKAFEALAFAAALFLPLLGALYYFAVDRTVPFGDAANYLYPGFWALKAQREHGFWAMLSEIYWHRDWKPIFHPVLALPALLATGGDSRLSVALVNPLIFAVFLAYFYLLSRIFLGRVKSIFLVWFIGTLPWVLKAVFLFGNELPFWTCCAAFVYYLYTQRDLNVGRDTVLMGLFLGGAACFQPFLAASSLGASFLAYIVFLVWKRRLGVVDLALSVPPLLLTALMYVFDDSGGGVRREIVLGAFLGLFVYLALWRVFLERVEASNWFYRVFSISFSIFFLWNAPFVRGLLAWATQCTVGLTTYHWTRGGNAFLVFWSRVISDYGRVLPVAVFLLGAVAFALGHRRARTEHRTFSAFLAVLVLSLPVAGMMTFNTDTRYYGISFIFLYFLATVYIWGKGAPKALQYALVFCMASGIFMSFFLVFDWRGPEKDYLRRFVDYGGQVLEPDPSDNKPSRFLETFGRFVDIQNGDQKRVGLFINNGGERWVPDDFQSNLIAMERGFQVRFDKPWFFYEIPRGEFHNRLRCRFDYIVLTLPLNKDFEVWDPLTHEVGMEFIDMWGRGRLAELGWAFTGTMRVDDLPTEFLIVRRVRGCDE